MALESGIPPEGRTLCVIAALLTGKESGRELAEKLERYHLANRDSGGELRLGMLADLPDRDSPMGAEGRSWVREARKEVDRLNRKYGGGFYLFFREPRYSARDGRWMGWERKRGALVELISVMEIMYSFQKDRKLNRMMVMMEGFAMGKMIRVMVEK